MALGLWVPAFAGTTIDKAEPEQRTNPHRP